VDLPAVFQTGIVHGYPPFRGFSPSVATRPSRATLSSMPFPTLRCRGSEDLSQSAVATFAPSGKPVGSSVFYTLRCSATLRTDAFTTVGVVHTSGRSLLSWSLSPFEDDLPASLRTSTELLSWASIVHPRPLDPLAVHLEPKWTCALQSVKEPEELTRNP